MYKKISGVDEANCRDNIINARNTHDDYMAHLATVKDIDAQRRAANDMERAEMRKQERQAASFKFGKMSKLKMFFPSLNTKGFLQVEPMTSLDKGTLYMEGFTRDRLLWPEKVTNYSKVFGLQKTCDGSYFSKPIGREIDQFDEVMAKYMSTRERGV